MLRQLSPRGFQAANAVRVSDCQSSVQTNKSGSFLKKHNPPVGGRVFC